MVKDIGNLLNHARRCELLPIIRFCFFGWFLAAVFGTGDLCAEILPEKGVFDGIYHRDRWGVGRFSFFVVEKQLHEQFDKYEGRRIRVHVTQGSQIRNPGPVFMRAISSITPLPEPPLGIRIELVPPDPAPNEPFQLICWFDNLSENTCFVWTRDTTIKMRCTRSTEWPEKPSFFHRSGSVGKIATYEWSAHNTDNLVSSAPWHASQLATSHRIAIPAGKSFPLAVIFDQGLPTAESEIEITSRGSEK